MCIHNRRQWVVILLVLSLALVVSANESTVNTEMFTVYPIENLQAVSNPMKGFRANLGKTAINHEYATLARHYIRWNQLENQESDTIQKIKDFCNQKWAGIEEHGIKVIPRVYLDWDKKSGNEYWPADMITGDYSSDQFKQRLERLIYRLGACWDKDPRVAWVQMGLIGYWGEHHSPAPTQEIQTLMGDAFTKAFTNKKVLVRHADEFLDYEFGIYWDSWAHIQQINRPSHGAGIENLNKAAGRWLTHPIEGETAYNWGNWKIQPGESPDDTLSDPVHREFLLDSIRRLHCSGLGWVSGYNQDNEVIRAGAAEVQKAFGYRFVIPQFSCSRRVSRSGILRLVFSVLNTGSAPFYEDWPLEFSLLDPGSRVPVWKTTLDSVDIREWLPGDNWDDVNNVYLTPAKVNRVDVTIPLPGRRLPAGEYIAALAILEPAGLQPHVRFAVKNYFKGGYHPFGLVGVGRDISGGHELDQGIFDNPKEEGRLTYRLEP